jgi:hypothetical protein
MKRRKKLASLFLKQKQKTKDGEGKEKASWPR